MLCAVVANVLEMLCDTFGYGNLVDGDSERLHQVDSVEMGAVGGAEAWHGDAMYSFAVEREIVECAYAYE